MKIDDVNAHDDRALGEWFRSLDRSEKDAFPDDPGWTKDEVKVFIRNPTDAEAMLAVSRDGDGVAVGSFGLSLPIRENLQLAFLQLAVDPLHRGRGAGRALLEHAEQCARDRGRTTISCRTDEKLDGEDSRNTRFARAAGYRVARTDVRRDLLLPMPQERITALRSGAFGHARGYDLVTWQGRCPDELAAGRAELSRVMSLDAPHGDLELDEEVWDETRLRNWERDISNAGRILLGAGAVDVATGELVGFSEVGMPKETKSVALQFDTVVSPRHRGHRLGLLIKLANLDVIQAAYPDTVRIITNNAQENAFMIATNDAMGFELVSRAISWHKSL